MCVGKLVIAFYMLCNACVNVLFFPATNISCVTAYLCGTLVTDMHLST